MTTYHSALDAIGFLKARNFLNIEMNGLTGLQLIESLEISSPTIYEKYALKGYELKIANYFYKKIIFKAVSESLTAFLIY